MITTRGDAMKAKKLPAVHPGEILQEEFMEPLGLSQNALARALKVPPRRINELVHGKRSVSVDTALRLARYWDTTPDFWLNLQTHYDLVVAGEELASRIAQEVKVREKAA